MSVISALAVPADPGLTPELVERIARAFARYADPAAYPDLSAGSAGTLGEGSEALEGFMQEGRELALEMRAQWRTKHTVAEEVPDLLHRLHATLQHYGNFATYQAPRIGGVLAGCPRGPRPRPESLAFDARLMARWFSESVYGTALLPPKEAPCDPC
jgi:hypothetical protein